MSVQRLESLEGRVERLGQVINGLSRSVADLGQKLAQAFARMGMSGAQGALIRCYIPSSVTGAGFGTAVGTTLTLAVRSGNAWTSTGGQSVTAYHTSATNITGPTNGYVTLRADGTYEIALWDC